VNAEGRYMPIDNRERLLGKSPICLFCRCLGSKIDRKKARMAERISNAGIAGTR
jgi:hypothetical protein